MAAVSAARFSASKVMRWSKDRIVASKLVAARFCSERTINSFSCRSGKVSSALAIRSSASAIRCCRAKASLSMDRSVSSSRVIAGRIVAMACVKSSIC